MNTTPFLNPLRIPRFFTLEVTTTAASQSVKLPMNAGEVHNATVFWGDGTKSKITTVNVGNTHIYTDAGVYQIKMTGRWDVFDTNILTATEKSRITNVIHWGETVQFEQLKLRGCLNITVLTPSDIPDFTGWASIGLNAMFSGCTNLTGIDHINEWVFPPNITELESMFASGCKFNQSIDNWDVSGISSFTAMFLNNIVYNQDMNSWDVSAGITFDRMFEGCNAFNGNITSWQFKTTGTINMSSMFYNALTFNQDISAWNVERVTTMASMLRNTNAFNQNLPDWSPGTCTTFAFMFQDCNNFNGTVTNWDTSSATTMNNMFFNADAFNQSVDGWDVSSVTNFNSMFQDCPVYNQSMNSWTLKTSGGTVSCQSMFQNAQNFNGNVSSWNVSNVSSMASMFRDTNFSGDLSGWAPTATLTNLSQTFWDTPFNSNIGSWNVSGVTNMSWTFYSCNNFNQNLNNWNTSNVLTMNLMFEQATSYNQPMNLWDVSKVTTMERMFYDANSFDQDITGWITTALLNTSQMFRGINVVFNQDISGWDVSKVTNFSSMFQQNDIFSQDLSNWDISSATSMNLFGTGSGFTIAQYDAMLIAWEGLTTPPSSILFAINAGYTETQGESGTTDGTATNKLIDSTATFLTSGVAVNDIVRGGAGYAKVTAIDSDTQLSLDFDTAVSGETYFIQTSNVAKARYSLFRTYSWTITDGGPV